MKIIFMAIIAMLALVGCTEVNYEESDIDMRCVAFSQEQEQAQYLHSTVNYPSDFNCTELQDIIYSDTYPSSITLNYAYREPICGVDNETIVGTSIEVNTEEIYKNYYFDKCLSKVGGRT